MKKLIDQLSNIGAKMDVLCKAVLGIQMIALIFLVIIQILLRMVDKSLPWATECSCLLFVWASLLGAAVAGRYMLHIGVDALKDRLTGKSKEIFMLISHTILMFGLIIFVFSSAEYTMVQIDHMATTMPSISLAWFYCSLPIGGVIMLFYTIIQFLQIICYGDAVRLETFEEKVEENREVMK